MARLTETEKLKISQLNQKGLSSRQIAKRVFGSATRKSTINDFLKSLNKPEPLNILSKAKILIIDIETSPSLGYFWKRWKTNIYQEQVVSESHILTYSAKWLGDDNIIFGFLEEKEVKKENDERLVKELYSLLDSADLVIAHNAYGFDIPFINARLAYHNMTPPSPYRIIDTLRIARNNFKFPSNALDSLCKYLGIEGKTDNNGFATWRGFLNYDEECVKTMIDYNCNDVIILENLYLKLRAFDKSHPNIQVYSEINLNITCPCCGSEDVDKTDKLFYTSVSAFPTFVCLNCGKRFRERRNVLDRENLIQGI